MCVRKKSCATEISCWLQTGICVTTLDGICMANWQCAENQLQMCVPLSECIDIPAMEGRGWGHTSYGGGGTYDPVDLLHHLHNEGLAWGPVALSRRAEGPSKEKCS